MSNDKELDALEDLLFEAIQNNELPSRATAKMLVLTYSVTSPGASSLRHDLAIRVKEANKISYPEAKERVTRLLDSLMFMAELDHDRPEVEHPLEAGPTIEQAATVAQEMLGQRITAAAVGVKDPKRVGAWKAGDSKPQGVDERKRLLALGAVLAILIEAVGRDADLIEGWILSPNQHLRDRSPLEAIREDDGRIVLAAARLFAA